MGNLFREALEIWNTKRGSMTEEERKLLSAAMIPLMILPEYNDTLIEEGLEELAKMVEHDTVEEGRV